MSLTKTLYITTPFTIMILQRDFASVIYSIYSPNISVIRHPLLNIKTTMTIKCYYVASTLCFMGTPSREVGSITVPLGVRQLQCR